MFLAFEYGVMYVLSFAMIITGIVTALALVLWLVRSLWRLLAKEGGTLYGVSHERTVPEASHSAAADDGCRI